MNFIASTGYFGIAALMFIENVFPPIPSEFIMPLAGFMATKNQFSLFGVIVAGTIGSVVGALPLYYLGRKVGEEKLKDFAGRHGRWLTLSPRDIEKSKKWFDKYGSFAVLICHLIPGMRSIISIPAGIDQMNLFSFLFFTMIGAGIWTAVLACAGYFLGNNFREIENYLDPILYVVLAAVAIFYIARVIRHKGANDND